MVRHNVLGVLVMIFAISSLLVRLRRSTGEERVQIKWVVFTAMIACVGFLSAFIVDFSAGFILGLVALAAIPIAAGIAILKYRLYEIDRVVNRTVVYGAVTALLAGLYFGIVIGLQQVFSGFTRGNDLAIAGSTLAVAALFRPARRRIQTFVDRRFYRSRYDADQTLAAFSHRLRDEVDLDELGSDLGAVVHDTMQPSHVSLWLRPTRTKASDELPPPERPSRPSLRRESPFNRRRLSLALIVILELDSTYQHRRRLWRAASPTS